MQKPWVKDSFRKEEWRNSLYSYIFEIIAKFLYMSADEGHDLIINLTYFETSIRPYLKDVIKVAKFHKTRNEKQSVTHYFNGSEYKNKNNIEDEPIKETPTINFRTSYGYGDLSFSSALIFKEKNITLPLSWDQFNDLLRLSSCFSAEDLPLSIIFKGQKLSIMFFGETTENTIGFLDVQSALIYMTAEEFKDLFSIFSYFQPSKNKSIDLIQYQLGSI